MILLSQSMMKDDVKVFIAIIRSLTVCPNKLNVDDSMTVVDDSMKLEVGVIDINGSVDRKWND